MFWPVFAAILTTQAAFLPLFFVRDVIGQIMSALPMVVIAALTASLIESFPRFAGASAPQPRQHEARAGPVPALV
jgi:hypothetical protein